MIPLNDIRRRHTFNVASKSNVKNFFYRFRSSRTNKIKSFDRSTFGKIIITIIRSKKKDTRTHAISTYAISVNLLALDCACFKDGYFSPSCYATVAVPLKPNFVYFMSVI